MEDLPESGLIIDDSKVELLPFIVEELRAIPPGLLRFVLEKGIKLCVPIAGDRLFFVRNRLTDWGETPDGEKYTEISYFSDGEGAIIITGNGFIKDGYPHSVVIHEFAHAIDCVLGHAVGHRGKFLHQELPEGTPLDFYAASDGQEKFATAFEAFCHPELFCSKDYRTHNRLELFRKSPKIFKYFEQFFADWEKGA